MVAVTAATETDNEELEAIDVLVVDEAASTAASSVAMARTSIVAEVIIEN